MSPLTIVPSAMSVPLTPPSRMSPLTIVPSRMSVLPTAPSMISEPPTAAVAS